MKRLRVFLEYKITNFPFWQIGHAPIILSSSLDFFSSLLSCAPITLSFSFNFSVTGFRISMAFCSTFSLVSFLCWISFIFSSSFLVSSGDTTVGQYFFRTSITSKPRSVTTILSSRIYFLSYSVCMIPTLVAFVPISSFSIFLRRLLGLYLGGGLVNLSSEITLSTLTLCPSSIGGKDASSDRAKGL